MTDQVLRWITWSAVQRSGAGCHGLLVSDALALTLARAIRAERSRKGLSQTELGERLGWSQSTVAAAESGTRRVYASELPEICEALGVPLTRLLADATAEDLRRLGL